MAVAQRETWPREDPVGHYMSGVSRHDLLTAAEEVLLARAIEEGQNAARRLEVSGAAMDPEERLRLRHLVRRGNEARDRFIRSNLRLVVSLARRYTGRGLDLLDLIQEGNLGLMRAVEKFDWRKGFKFSTYATWWIRQAITRGLGNQGRTVRLPLHLLDTVRMVHDIAATLSEELHRAPRPEEIASVGGIDPARVMLALSLPEEPTSLDRPLSSDGDAVIADVVATPDGAGDPPPFEVALDASRRRHVARALRILSDEERRLVVLRYGLDGSQPATLESLAAAMGLTRERVRQGVGRALAKLRHPSSDLELETLL